jgi:hypothetical protein
MRFRTLTEAPRCALRLRRGRGFVLPFSGGQEHLYYGSHEQSAAQLDPRHDRLGAQHHRIKKPLHGENLPFAFDELYEIRALLLQATSRPEHHPSVRAHQEHSQEDERQPELQIR